MVHVTFNEKVECHQYSPTPTTHTEEMQPNNRNNDRNPTEGATSSSVSGQSRLKYNQQFLMDMRESDLSKICPEVVKKAIEENKGWTGSDPISTSSGRPIVKGGSVFSRQPYNYNFRPRGRLVPFFTNNQTNGGYLNREDMPLEPIGSNRLQSRHYPNRNSFQDYGNISNRNLLPEFAQRCDGRASSGMRSEEDAEPEWYRSGPTSPNDFIDLHGFEGPEDPENQENDPLGCVDSNISGGPTSGASSNNGSPPAKSTPAKNILHGMNDVQRPKRPATGRSNNWQNSFDNRRSAGAPPLTEFFRNFAGAQNQSNLRGLTPIVSVEDVESSLLYDRLKFRQMVAQMHTQNVCRNLLYPQHEPVPNASQVLSEIDKILRTSTEQVYKRPEVRTLIKNIVEAVIPPINILNLLKNPLTEPQDRETIQSVLKIITQAQQNATIAMKMHTPTQAELRAHMDAIMQDAIIKKKMESLSNELLKGSPGGRQFSTQAQAFHQLFQQSNAGRFEKQSQSDSRGHCQSVENGKTLAQENNLNRWFSSSLLNKGLSGALPQIPIDLLRSEELESTIKQKLNANEKEVK